MGPWAEALPFFFLSFSHKLKTLSAEIRQKMKELVKATLERHCSLPRGIPHWPGPQPPPSRQGIDPDPTSQSRGGGDRRGGNGPTALSSLGCYSSSGLCL